MTENSATLGLNTGERVFGQHFATGYLLCALLLVGLLMPRVGWAQAFGKNKITAQRFDWHIHRTEHFDIHYYPSEAKLVPIMAAIAEEAYEQHSEDFEHELQDRTPLILYKSHKDFQETNIILTRTSRRYRRLRRTL